MLKYLIVSANYDIANSWHSRLVIFLVMYIFALAIMFSTEIASFNHKIPFHWCLISRRNKKMENFLPLSPIFINWLGQKVRQFSTSLIIFVIIFWTILLLSKIYYPHFWFLDKANINTFSFVERFALFSSLQRFAYRC